MEELTIINNLLREFLWKGKRPKITLNTLMKKREQGGIRLVNLKHKQDSIRISWVFRIEDDPFLAECTFDALSPVLRQLIWKCNLKTVHVNRLFETNNFGVKILVAWSKVNYCDPCNKIQVLEQVIWYNSNILIGNNPICWKEWFNKGIITVGDLYDVNNLAKSAEDLGVNWLELIQVLKAIPRAWKLMIREEDNGPPEESLYSKLLKAPNTRNHIVYDKLIDDDSALVKYFRRRLEEGVLLDFQDYQREFSRLYKYTKRTKFRDFQYRLLLGKIVTNRDLLNWGIKDSNLCELCKKEIESVVHLFCECEKVKPIRDFIYEFDDGESVLKIAL